MFPKSSACFRLLLKFRRLKTPPLPARRGRVDIAAHECYRKELPLHSGAGTFLLTSENLGALIREIEDSLKFPLVS